MDKPNQCWSNEGPWTDGEAREKMEGHAKVIAKARVWTAQQLEVNGAEWRTKRSNPCPICGKPDWCKADPEGRVAICKRTEGEPFGNNGDPELHVIDLGAFGGEGSVDLAPIKREPPKPLDFAERMRRSGAYMALLSICKSGVGMDREIDAICHQFPWLAEGNLYPVRFPARDSAAARDLLEQLSREHGAEAFAKVPGFNVVGERITDAAFPLGQEGIGLPVWNQEQDQLEGFQIKIPGAKYVWFSDPTFDAPSPRDRTNRHLPVAFYGEVDRDGDMSSVIVTEGQKKAAVASQFFDACDAISIPGVGSWGAILPELARREVRPIIRLAFDMDYEANPQVKRALDRLREALRRDGYETWTGRWDSKFKGLDDILMAQGPEAIEWTEDGKEEDPEPEPEEDVDALTEMDRTEREDKLTESQKATQPQETTRVQIYVSADEHVTVQQTTEALGASGRVFQQSGQLVELSRDDAGRPIIAPIAKGRLRSVIASCCELVKVVYKKEGPEKAQVHPPAWLVDSVHAASHWPDLPVLSAVAETPVMRPDGTVLDQPGYDPGTRLYFKPKRPFPRVPENPTLRQAQDAAAMLQELVADFPFKSEADRSGWIAGLLTPLARPGFEGPAPLHHFDANLKGSGKTLLASLVGELTSEGGATPMRNARNPEELSKTITSILMQGSATALVDNVSGEFGGEIWDALLTARRWTGRILGASKMWSGPAETIWYSTGNNVTLAGDMDRRMLRIRLASAHERPEERGGFEHPDLLRHARENRGRYVAAALTILRAYHAAGKPSVRMDNWNGYEGWSAAVRAPLVWAGLVDPAETRAALKAENSHGVDALHELLLEWEEVFGGEGVSIRDLCAKVEQASAADLRLALCEALGLRPSLDVTAYQVRRRLGGLKEKPVGGKMLVFEADASKKTGGKWKVVTAQAPNPRPTKKRNASENVGSPDESRTRADMRPDAVPNREYSENVGCRESILEKRKIIDPMEDTQLFPDLEEREPTTAKTGGNPVPSSVGSHVGSRSVHTPGTPGEPTIPKAGIRLGDTGSSPSSVRGAMEKWMTEEEREEALELSGRLVDSGEESDGEVADAAAVSVLWSRACQLSALDPVKHGPARRRAEVYARNVTNRLDESRAERASRLMEKVREGELGVPLVVAMVREYQGLPSPIQK